MVRTLPLCLATAVLLSACQTFDGKSEQQLADTYFSCIVLVASRDNQQMTEWTVRDAHGECHEDVWPYARALVASTKPSLRPADVSSGAIQILSDLADQTVLEMREDGVIE